MNMIRIFLVMIVGMGSISVCEASPISEYGTVTLSQPQWEGEGREYVRSMVTYENNTPHTFKTVQIQCIAYDENNTPISDFWINYSTRLNNHLIQPGTKKTKEASLKGGEKVKSISCSVEKAALE